MTFGLAIALFIVAAAGIWLAVAALVPGDGRKRLTLVAWFGLAVAPFVGSPLIWGDTNINSLPISAITSLSLLLVAGFALTLRSNRRFPPKLKPFAVASIALWVVMIVSNIGAGAPTELRAVSGGLALAVVFLTVDKSKWPLTGLLWGLLTLTVLSLILGFTNDLAWTHDLQRFPLPIAPPVNGRLIGLSFSPNHLGYIAGLLVVVQILGPKTRLPTIPVLSIATLTVLYSGSRSTLLGLAVAAAAAVLIGQRRSVIWWLTGAAVGVASWILISDSLRVSGHVDTLNGRTIIWNAVLNSFDSHQIFGIGPGGWSRLVDAYHLPAYAVEGHNQVIDTLGKQGVVGLLVLVAWVVVAVVTITRLEGRDRVLPTALLGFMVGRSVFEVPLDVYFIGPGTISIAAFAAAAAWSPARATSKAPTAVASRATGQSPGPGYSLPRSITPRGL
jgi:hypothetical protein